MEDTERGAGVDFDLLVSRQRAFDGPPDAAMTRPGVAPAAGRSKGSSSGSAMLMMAIRTISTPKRAISVPAAAFR